MYGCGAPFSNRRVCKIMQLPECVSAAGTASLRTRALRAAAAVGSFP